MVGLGPLVVFCKFCRQNNTVDRSQYGQRNKSGTPRRAFGRRHQLLTAGVVRVTKLTPGVSATLLRHAEHGDGPAAEDAGQPHAAHDGDDALDAPAEEGAAGGGALPGDRAGEQGRGWCGVETGEGKGGRMGRNRKLHTFFFAMDLLAPHTPSFEATSPPLFSQPLNSCTSPPTRPDSLFLAAHSKLYLCWWTVCVCLHEKEEVPSWFQTFAFSASTRTLKRRCCWVRCPRSWG
jgi:hypothetical protein